MLYLNEYVTEHWTKILSWSAESSQTFDIANLVKWYTEVPHCSTFRVNTLEHTVEEILVYLQQRFREKYKNRGVEPPEIKMHDFIPECITISKINTINLNLTPVANEVIVDSICGAAVLRGSDVFAPGVLSMSPKTKVGSTVSVYADIEGNCLQGSKYYSSDGKLFLGNGLVLQNRSHIFESAKKPSGVAVEMTDPVSGLTTLDCPSHFGILQNIPSMVCVRVLDPKPGETILDMCAAPGNKTTHIAALMNDDGILIAIDRKSRIKLIAENCSALKIRNCVHIFAGDSTQIVGEVSAPVTQGPPFSPESFDRILLDAACSGSGNRPMLVNRNRTEKALKSYPKVQKSLITNAVRLLKRDGILVYSTCSILCEENECVITWLLKTYPGMELVDSVPLIGSPGLSNCGLDETRFFLQRFGPGTQSSDSIGFFIAVLKKKSI